MQPLVALLLTLVAQLVLQPVVCHEHDGYNHDSSSVASNPQWMAYINGNTALSQLSLPGTHDSMAHYGGDAVQCQSMGLAEQLESGIRVLDIRCRHIDNACAIHHGSFYQHANLDDVLITVTGFLSANPTETILMRLKDKEHDDGEGVTRSFEDTFLDYRSRYANFFWGYTGNDNPKLDEVRGKIVLLQNFGANWLYGINWYTINNIQDAYSMGTNWDLYGKWEKVRAHLDAAANGDSNSLYVNFLSASGGSFPYFVASGHVSPGTGDARLATGKTTPGWQNDWPDFPRVDCFIGICTIAFEGTNMLTMDWSGWQISSRRVGIIMADFPGGGLINRIIFGGNNIVLNCHDYISCARSITAARSARPTALAPSKQAQEEKASRATEATEEISGASTSGTAAAGGSSKELMCLDHNPSCSKYVRNGDCTKNADYMLRACCASCLEAAEPPLEERAGEVCGDWHAYCGLWAGQGKCEEAAGYMSTACCSTCSGSGLRKRLMRKMK
jgi:1-phosphatidylinositol phosphodiesterase